MDWNKKLQRPKKYIAWFWKWAFLAVVMGIVGGLLGALFHHVLHFVTHLRLEHTWLVLLLPVGGVLTVCWYRLLKLKRNRGTNEIIDAVLDGEELKPQIAPGGTLTGMITVRNNNFFPEQKQYSLRYLCPEGWQVEGARSTYCSYQYLDREAKYNYNQVPFTIHAGEQVAAVNNIILEVTSPGRPNPILVPIQVMG